jgi:hypothetical protein
MQNTFYELTDAICGKLTGDEVLLANFSGEDSDFVRFNNAKVRQGGSVAQSYFTMELIDGRRHAKLTASLVGDRAEDERMLTEGLESLRRQLPHVPEDPYLLYATDGQSGEQHGDNRLPERGDVLGGIADAAAGKDLVGIYAQGGIFDGASTTRPTRR